MRSTIALAIAFSYCRRCLDNVCPLQQLTFSVSHIMDGAEAADIAGVERWHFISVWPPKVLRVALCPPLALIPAHIITIWS